MLHRAEVGEGQHCDPRLDPEPRHELCGGGRDFSEGLGVRLDVHRRVGEEEGLLAEDHHVDAADVLAPRLGADHVERRAQRIWIVDLLPGDQRVRASGAQQDRKSTRLNSSHVEISYAVFCLKKKKTKNATWLSVKKKKKQNTQT